MTAFMRSSSSGITDVMVWGGGGERGGGGGMEGRGEGGMGEGGREGRGGEERGGVIRICRVIRRAPTAVTMCADPPLTCMLIFLTYTGWDTVSI